MAYLTGYSRVRPTGPQSNCLLLPQRSGGERCSHQTLLHFDGFTAAPNPKVRQQNQQNISHRLDKVYKYSTQP